MPTIFEPQSLTSTSLQDRMREILVRLGEGPVRDGLRETPERRERSMQWLTKGYQENPEELLQSAMFDVDDDEMVIIKDIEIFSLCEHHMLPFCGEVHLAHIPDGKVIGLSKVPQLVDVFARRLPVQERLTTEIAKAVKRAIKPRGVAAWRNAAFSTPRIIMQKCLASIRRINLVLGSRVSSPDVHVRSVQLENGKTHTFGTLLMATGAEPVRLQIEGATDSQIHYFRTFADSKATVAKAASAKRVVVVGASFIGLEVAASLRARDRRTCCGARWPATRTRDGEMSRHLHKGASRSPRCCLHLGETVRRIDGRAVTLSRGTIVDADFVVLGVGVRPAVALAERAGLTIDRGISVNEYLETSAAGIFAAGDVARWPDPPSGDRIRVEHWVIAERQGQVTAKNILGQRQRFITVPFFWSQHDVAINYVGRAEKWDAVGIDGNLDVNDCAVTYKRLDRTLAVATISRDLRSLQTELAMESV